MRRYSLLPLLCLTAAIAAAGCGSDDNNPAGPRFSYSLTPAAPTLAVGQDSAAPLGVTVKRSGTDTTIKRARILYSSSDVKVATVDSAGNVTGVAGGSTTIKATLANATIDIPVTVRAHPADSVILTILTGPAGGFKAAGQDTGTFFALPADPATSRLRGVVKVGNDTVFCNYCAPKTPARVQRTVRFVSLNPALATVTNATNPRLQTSVDTTGRVTPLDTSAAGVRIVMQVPGDSLSGKRWADTVLVKFSLRPLDTLRIRPDSNFFPAANGTGLQKQIYPNADTVQANVVQTASGFNFIAGLDFLSKVQDIGPASNPNQVIAPRYIVSRLTGDPTVFRPSLPNVTWESANTNYLTINAAGAVTGLCAFIGGTCLTTGSSVLTCTATGPAMPQNFAGQGSYTVPSCNPAKILTPSPGAYCSTTSNADLSAMCTVYIRATAVDPVTGKILRRLYRINIRR